MNRARLFPVSGRNGAPPVRLQRARQRLRFNRSRRYPEDKLYTHGCDPPRYMGPVEMALVPGQGRGLVASQWVRAGELLVVSLPVAIVKGPPGSLPSNEQLMEEVTRAVGGDVGNRIVVRQLYDGSPASCANLPDFSVLAQRIYHGDRDDDPSGAAMSGQGMNADDRYRTVDISEVVRYNCYGMEVDDEVAVAVRGGVGQSFLGLWPELALVNHSCVPNALTYVVGDHLYLRAIRDIPPGRQVTKNYLGLGNLAPASIRQAQLNESYRFSCGCERCRLEEDNFFTVGRLLQDVYARAQQEVEPALVKAVEENDLEAIRVCGSQLESLVKRLDTAVELAQLQGSEAEQWLRASTMCVYELLQVCKNHLDVVDMALMEARVAMTRAVAPASDLHLGLAVENYIQQSVSPDAGDECLASCLKEVSEYTRIRYGAVSQKMLQELISVRFTEVMALYEM